MPTALDGLALVFFAWVLLARPVRQRLAWAREVAAMRAPGGRLRRYRRAIVAQWVLASAAVAYAVSAGVELRGPAQAQLSLGLETETLPLAMLALAVLLTALYARPLLALRGPSGDELRSEARRQFDALELTPLLPHTPREYRAFLGLALTAGVCEELVYRGALHGLAALHELPLPLTALASTLLFAWAHQYQGVRGIVRTLLVGAVFCGLVLAAGSLWPAIVLHAGIDVVSGTLAFATLQERASCARELGAA